MNTARSHRKHQLKSAGHSPRVSSESVKVSSFALIRNIALGSGATTVFGLLLLLLITWIAHRSADPDSLTLSLSLAALYTTAFFAGILSTRLTKGTPLICGIVAGVLLLLLSLLIALGLPATGRAFPNCAPILRLLSPLFSLLGAYLIRKRNRPRRHRRK